MSSVAIIKGPETDITDWKRKKIKKEREVINNGGVSRMVGNEH